MLTAPRQHHLPATHVELSSRWPRVPPADGRCAPGHGSQELQRHRASGKDAGLLARAALQRGSDCGRASECVLAYDQYLTEEARAVVGLELARLDGSLGS